jgi:hypothetical protein
VSALEEEEEPKGEKESKLCSHSRVNPRHTPMCLHRFNVLGETNRFSISTSQVLMICKSSKQVGTGGGGGCGGGEGGAGE